MSDHFSDNEHVAAGIDDLEELCTQLSEDVLSDPAAASDSAADSSAKLDHSSQDPLDDDISEALRRVSVTYNLLSDKAKDMVANKS